LKLTKIKKEKPNLEFKKISDEFVHKQINKTSVKNATGRNGISAKLLKLAMIVGQQSFDLGPPIHLSKK
jgi:hypothetical protein